MRMLSHATHPAHELCAPSLLLQLAPPRRVPLALLLRQSRIQAAHRLDRALHQARQCEQLLLVLDHSMQLEIDEAQHDVHKVELDIGARTVPFRRPLGE